MSSSMISKVFENEDVVVLNVNVNSFVTLKCGCTIPLHTLMLVMGHQMEKGLNCVCPLHNADHEFTDDDIMKSYSVLFLEHALSGIEGSLVTTFPPPSL